MTRLSEQLVVIKVQYLIIPWNITIAFHLIKIEIGTEEIGYPIILLSYMLVRTLIGVLEIIVDISQAFPSPSVFACGTALSHQCLTQFRTDIVIGILFGKVVNIGKQAIKMVCPQLELRPVLEIRFRTKRIFWSQIQVTRRKNEQAQ